MIGALIYPLLFLLVALICGNNLSACSGAIISGGVVDKKTGITIAIAGYIAGFLIEGNLLRTGLIALMPVQSELLVAIALLVALVVFVVAHLIRVPQSFSITFAMAIIGISLAYGNVSDLHFVSYMVGFWIASTFVVIFGVLGAMRFLRDSLLRTNVWNAVRRIKLLLVVASFLTAFVLGANTIGFLFVAVEGITNVFYSRIIVVAAMVLGAFLFSSGELRTVGSDIIPVRYLNALVTQSASVIIVEMATVFSIPVSNTQVFTASLYGAGLGYKTRLIRKRPMFDIIIAWVLTAIVSLVLGFAVTSLIYHL